MTRHEWAAGVLRNILLAIAGALACNAPVGAQEHSVPVHSMTDKALYDALNEQYAKAAATGSKSAAELVSQIVEERERRRPPKGLRSTAAYSAFLMSGQTDRAMAERRKKHLAVPAVNLEAISRASLRPLKSGEAKYWYFDAQSRLVPGVVNLSTGDHIVVYAGSACGPCRSALASIMSDPMLRLAFQKHSVWIETPDSNFGEAGFESWRKHSPLFPLRAVFDRANWPERDIAGTPYFFFLQDGKLQAKVLGWTDETAVVVRNQASALSRAAGPGLSTLGR